jgi:hypothetical protein
MRNLEPTRRRQWSRRNVAQAIMALIAMPLANRAAKSAEAIYNGRNQFASGIFLDHEAAKTVGNVYLRDHPLDAPEIIRLGQRLETTGQFGCDLLTAVIVKKISDDFNAARVVSVDGWIIAQTEARLCALMVLN